MDIDPGNAEMAAVEHRCRQRGCERRTTGERRRSPRGWLEMRARREGIEVDRRRRGRSAGWLTRVLLALSRREERV